MFELAKIAFTDVARLARSGKALTILPVGVVEEHGAHLPLGLDSFAAEVYTAAATPHLEAQGYEVVVAPTINYGVARTAIDFPGTLSLEPDTLRSMVVEIGRSLARHGLDRLVILNGHRDLHHMKALEDARKILVEENTARVLCVGFASDPQMTAACYREGVRQFYKSAQPDREGHGGESETSVALHSFPDLVNHEALATLDPNFDYDVEAFRNETKDYGSISGGRGYFGAPRAATAETGKQLVKVRGQNIARVVLKEFGRP
jgi:creatinine amidohydrolase